MAAYIHHIPGRLRVRSAAIKGNAARAAAVQRAVLPMAGVLSAEVSTTTGSVVIQYDTAVVDSQSLLSALKDLGCMAPEATLDPGTGRADPAVAAQPAWGAISKVVVGVLVEKLVERSAAALITAII